jgi:transposase
MRVTAGFSRLLRLDGVWIRDVQFNDDRVLVTVALRRRRLVCPEFGYSTRYRHNRQRVESVWRHLDLGTWRLEVRAQLRRLGCPTHGVRVEGVPFARHRAGFTRDFECLVAWLASRTDKTTITRVRGRCARPLNSISPLERPRTARTRSRRTRRLSRGSPPPKL